MLQLTTTLKAKAALLGKEAWGHLAASLVGSKTSALWDLLEDLFGKMSEAEEEESPPSKRNQSKDKPSTSCLAPSVLTSASTIPQPAPTKTTVIFPMKKSSLHSSGLKPEYLPVHEKLTHNKAIYLCGFYCGYNAQSRATVCTHICKEHLHIMLGCPHCEHCVWSTDAWAKHIYTHHLVFPCLCKWSWSIDTWESFGSPDSFPDSISCSIYLYLIHSTGVS